MIVYNITISVDRKIEGEFIRWMKDTYIPMVLNTGYFFDYRFLRLLNHPEEGEGVNFATQFYAETMEKMMGFENQQAHLVQEALEKRFQGEFVFFRSLLESVD
ncbi:hypothetical protein ADIS_4354 [Lunatimonas lonarensis]|uniref:DUF4286 domain-containing protein n=1 Tax=Lunatimonas lonarensis TaxID=1232681 RepID=R7ZM55_9BACT|nr:DUF4286 family protein [Lunatimonas lonarensis]EON75183.1 hypothetical protein ADIS_4354 [Lunatimonas lonarensis]